MKQSRTEEINELYNKITNWFPEWFSMLTVKYEKHLKRQRERKRKNSWRYRRNIK